MGLSEALFGVIGILLGVLTSHFTISRKFENIVTGIAVNAGSISNIREDQKQMNKSIGKNLDTCNDTHKETLGLIRASVENSTILINKLC